MQEALRYAMFSGDYAWLQNHMPKLELALEFLLNMYDPQIQLVNSPGPLWIDVFIRNNYTSDTNSIFVYLLRYMAGILLHKHFDNETDANAFLNQTDLAQQRLQMADNIATAMNKYLWSSDDDHFVTQMVCGLFEENLSHLESRWYYSRLCRL